ncbi:two-component system sensor histidine kinase NtrB [Pseudochrobactrum sp. MP213Fo]|uniref:two-component system sensor histidine kinase NtrB n=1 Tax=Pseudochrobactrum sp. MP213Fo TaxID=3022250 RepID=UPI003BA00F5B
MDIAEASLPAHVLNTLPQAVIMADRSGKIIYANAQAEVFFRSSAAILKRHGLNYFLPPSSPLVALIAQVIQSGTAVNEYHIDLSSPRLGTERMVDVQVTPVNEIPEQVVILFKETAMAEKLNRQMNHRGAARSISGLAAMLAHEIKNPLSGIRGAAQLLEMSAREAAGSANNAGDYELTQLIRDETDRIVALVDRMNVFSDERPIERSAVNLHTVLGHVKMLAQHGFASHVTIREEYDPSLPRVWGNRDQLIQVFLNLVKNAAEAIKPEEQTGIKGEIILTSAYKAGLHMSVPLTGERLSLPLEFCVIDNGSGVAADILPILFDPFITTKTNGSGLGLPLVAKIIADHGGMIECESFSGKTIFRILLPVWKDGNGNT